MPSGRGGSGGHFGGGSFGGSRGGGHFGGSRGSSFSGPSFHWHGWHHPHVMFFFGRPVYMSAGRTGASSILGVFIVLAIIAAVFLGIGWSSYNEDLDVIRADYAYYYNMAAEAAENEEYQEWATVDRIEAYDLGSGKYCIYYHFYTSSGYKVDGFSFYVYSHADATNLKKDGEVLLALDTPNDAIVATTDSIPLDYMNTSLEDDAEYLDYLSTRDGFRKATYIAIGITAALIVVAVLIPLTAKKATAEQIAENKKGDSSNSTSTTTDSQDTKDVGVWRCRYCNMLNDGSKHHCDGCGAQRQN